MSDRRARPRRPGRVLYAAVRDRDYPRFRRIRDYLTDLGLEVVVADAVFDRSTARNVLATTAAIFLPRGPFDAVVLAEFSGKYAVISWLKARAARARHVVDGFVGYHESAVEDRGLVPPGSLEARVLGLVDRAAVELADIFLVDTDVRADRARRLQHGRAAVVNLPVGAPSWARPPVETVDRDTHELRVLYYGDFIPLHGVEHAVRAVLSLARRQPVTLTLVGRIAAAPDLAREIEEADRPDVVRLVGRVPEHELPALIADHDVILGIFGTSPKAASVIANKVWQPLAAGKPVLTRVSPALDELLPLVGDQLVTVEPGSAAAIEAALATTEWTEIKASTEVTRRLDSYVASRYAELGRLLRPQGRGRPLVLVHLDHGRGREAWGARWERGETLEPTPYGYQLAEDFVELTYSKDHPETAPGRFVRRALRRSLGFDVVHALRNRAALARADVVWTHTETEHLAIALLKRTRVLPRRLGLVAQSVWLWDRWASYGPVRRAFYRWLLGAADISTTHSTLNAALASDLLGHPVVEVPYGTRRLEHVDRRARRVDERLRVLSVGNDADRDWTILSVLAEARPDLDITVLSGRVPRGTFAGLPNVAVRRARTGAETLEAYAETDVVVVPLRPNQHVSGITVALEALNVGRPLVVTDVGGIRDYVGAVAQLVPPHDALALAEAVDAASRRDEAWTAQARDHVVGGGLTDLDFARRHVLLTYAVLDHGPLDPATSAFQPVETKDLRAYRA